MDIGSIRKGGCVHKGSWSLDQSANHLKNHAVPCRDRKQKEIEPDGHLSGHPEHPWKKKGEGAHGVLYDVRAKIRKNGSVLERKLIKSIDPGTRAELGLHPADRSKPKWTHQKKSGIQATRDQSKEKKPF